MCRFVNIVRFPHWLAGWALLGLAGCASAPPAPSETPPAVIEIVIPVPTIAPDQTTPKLVEAIAQLKRGKIAEAEALLTGIVETRKDVPEAWFNLGWAKLQRRKPAMAVEALQTGLKLRPDDARALNLLGLAFREQGQFSQAEETYRKGLQHAPTSARLHLNLGILYDLYLNKPDQALTSYRAYQQLQTPPDAKVAGWIAVLERKSRQTTPLQDGSAAGSKTP